MREPKDRIIFALDVGHFSEAQRFVTLLQNHVGLFKVGKQLFTHAGPKVIDMIRQKGQRTFLDLKFHDIPHTVAKASLEVTKLRVAMFNVHAAGGREMMEAAAKTIRATAKEIDTQKPAVLAVTVLTSLDNRALNEIGMKHSVEEQVTRLSSLAKKSGLDGVVASPREIRLIREACGEDFLVVTPGVRPREATKDDQKRVMTPGEAVEAGADYVVIGRPIHQAEDPVAAAQRISEEIGGRM